MYEPDTDATTRSEPANAWATIADVAQLAGTSTSSASRALSGRGYVSSALRQRIMDAAKELNYIANEPARALKGVPQSVIGVVVTDLRDSFYADLTSGVMSATRAKPVIPIVLELGRNESPESLVTKLVSMRIGGAVITPNSPQLGLRLTDSRVPVVEVDRRFSRGRSDGVVVDNISAGLTVMKHLVRYGHRRIALVVDELEWSTGRDRLSAYRQSLAENQLPDRTDWVIEVSPEDHTGVARRMRQLMEGDSPPTAIIAANSSTAESVLRAARQIDLRIPDDVSLAAFDDAPWMTLTSPMITTINQHPQLLGRMAVELLLRRIAEPDAPFQTIVADAELIERGSVVAPR
ncbi:LacI family transcriptional regulator [Microbacterium sp. SLBN-154]|uniref:LacI family DNA-binding transcriptional regulator n=1 Tax=Microbacterium sp. SLBN-154 TaxID=2768458 RepID=UPI0011691D0C|nr:LacI family DNA-binding transcriptional regulator [Microbacterium sp. SLBN-154]TQK17704.1 LacI family transcriptional regulator [Microbacterium sp. SLBN-154]